MNPYRQAIEAGDSFIASCSNDLTQNSKVRIARTNLETVKEMVELAKQRCELREEIKDLAINNPAFLEELQTVIQKLGL